MENNNNIFQHNGKLYQKEENEFYEKSKEIELAVQKPELKWKGGKIDYNVWKSIMSFLIWSQNRHKSESMITLFYNTETKVWAPWAFPQETNGMSVSMENESEEFVNQRKNFPDPWVELGSIHHHCNMGAFASGTDKEDEKSRDGLHITIGKLDQAKLDIHYRASFGGTVSETLLETWIQEPDFVQLIPDLFPELKKMALEAALLTKKCHNGQPFPKLWKENFKKKAMPTYPRPIIGYGQNNASYLTDGYHRSEWIQPNFQKNSWSEKKEGEELQAIMEKHEIRPLLITVFLENSLEESHNEEEWSPKILECYEEIKQKMHPRENEEILEILEQLLDASTDAF